MRGPRVGHPFQEGQPVVDHHIAVPFQRCVSGGQDDTTKPGNVAENSCSKRSSFLGAVILCASKAYPFLLAQHTSADTKAFS